MTDTPGSAPTSATWDAAGRQLTATDADGNQASWTYDSYGRVQSMTGYDGSVTTCGYDRAGQLRSASQPAKGQVVSYTYDRAGQLVSIVDTTTAVNGYQALVRETAYAYDFAGNRVRERTAQGGKLFADNRQTYDALHRLVGVGMADIGQGAQSIGYQYDGFGNRSRFASQAAGKGGERNQTGYFLYDALNRMVVSGALDAQGTVGAQTLRHVYDSAGNLANTVAGGRNTQFGYDAMNRVVGTSVNGVLAFTTSYDAAGRVVADAVASEDAPPITSGMPLPVEPSRPQEPPLPAAGSSQYVLDRYKTQKAQFDKDLLAYTVAMGVYQSDLQDYRDQNTYLDQFRLASAGSAYERHLKAYDAQGRLVVDQALQDNGAVRSLLVNEQFDAAGHVLRYHTESMAGEHVRNDYVNSYRTLTKAVVQSSSTGRMTLLGGKMAGKAGSYATSTDAYDANGFLIGVNYSTDGAAPASGRSNKLFVMDAEGNILLSREESHHSPTAEQRQIVANGELQLRFSTTYGKFDNLEKEQERAFWKAYNDDAYQSLVTPGGDLVVAPGANAGTGQVVVAAQGDTLQSIAARVYGSADAWYRLADANGLDFDSALVAGQAVVAPAATANSNKLDFDLGKLVGSTAPNLPPPPPDKPNCIMLIIVVVAVVVAAIVAPYALTAASGLVGGGATALTASTPGLMLAGAMTGAVASVASQVVAVAAGVQDKLDWKGVAMAAVGGAVGAGFNAVTSNAFVSAAASSVVTQGIQVMTGMQQTFSWAGVARAAVSAGVQSGVGEGDFGGAWARDGATEQFGMGFVRGGLAGLAGSLTTDLLIPGKQDWIGIGIGALGGGLAGGLAQQRAYNASRSDADAFGNALGQSLAGVSSGGSQQEQALARSFADDHETRIAANPVASWLDKQSRAEEAAGLLAEQATAANAAGAQAGVNPVVRLPQFIAQSEQSIISSGGTNDYQSYATLSDGTSQITRHTPRPGADDYLRYAQDGVSGYFNQMDDIASAAGSSTGARIFAASTYGVRKIASDTVNAVIGLSRLLTSDTMVPSMVNAAARPLQTGRSLINAFGNMPLQDQLVTGLEAALPFKAKIERLAEGAAIKALKFDAAAESAKFQGDYPYLGVDPLQNTSLPVGRQIIQLTHATDGVPVSSCLDSCDYAPFRSWPLFKARHVLSTLIHPN
ncbi:LysM peptidoglycan-binding domain-containing protein, partial [Rugamonas sp. CCM 8940]|nr:LysM peptidoglycan-binding domain-containing protein [Rugamonas sp. CCM 8940]